MNAVLMPVEVALFASQAMWACALLVHWLWCQRRVPVSVHRRCTAVPPAADAGAHPRAKPEWVRREVIYLASHLGSCRKVTHAFNRRHGRLVTVGKTWVARLLRAHGQEIRHMRRERRRRLASFIPVGHTWALDLTFIRSPYGMTFTVLGIIDAGSRKLLCLKVLPTKCAFAILGHLFLAFSQHGLPQAIRTDNEAMFTSKVWLETLKALGIACRRGPPCQPWHNGRMERLFGTLKQAVGGSVFAAADALQRTLDEFLVFYNQCRPHQGLGGLTPQEAWQGMTMQQVQQLHVDKPGQWVQAMGGAMVAFHVRR